MKRLILALLCLPASAVMAQTAGQAGNGSTIQMTPLNALKPQATTPQPSTQGNGTAAGGIQMQSLPAPGVQVPAGQGTGDTTLLPLPTQPGQTPQTVTPQALTPQSTSPAQTTQGQGQAQGGQGAASTDLGKILGAMGVAQGQGSGQTQGQQTQGQQNQGQTLAPAQGQGQGQTLQPGQPPGTLTTEPNPNGVAPVVVPGTTTTTTTNVQVTDGTGGVVRWLDKVSGDTADLTIAKGQSATKGRLTITLTDCRYPVGDPSGNAYAYLSIKDSSVKKPIFAGWMIASNPALDPLDSARYDVWLLHCTTK